MTIKNTSSLKKTETGKDLPIERTTTKPSFLPYTDIVESENGLIIDMDIPGAEEKNIDVNIEDDILSVSAKVEAEVYEGYRPLYSEYAVGDFNRSFKLVDDFNTAKIQATFKNGVLSLFLPKAEKKKPRKITIKTE